MRYIFFLFVFVSAQWLHAQSALKFQQSYGGFGYEYGYGIVQTPDLGYAIAGTTSSAGITDGWLVRTDSLGLLLWTKYFSLPQIDVLRSIVLLPDSGFALAGYTNSKGYGGYDGWVIRTDKNGDTLWTRNYGTTDWDLFYSITATWDGGFLCAGGTYGAGNGDEDIYLVRLDANGNELWTKTIGGARMDEGRSIIETSDSLFALAANTYSLGDTLGDGWLLHLDVNGDTLWTQKNGYRDTADFLYDVCDLAYLDRLLVCGEVNAADQNVLMRSYGYAGNTNFTISFTTAGTERFNGIAVRPDNSFGTTGFTSTLGWTNGDAWFFTDDGFFTTTFGQGFGTDELFDITGTADNGFAACGYMTPNGNLLPDLYLVKIDSTGYSTTILGIFDAETSASTATVFVYPNPAVDAAVLQITSRNTITETPQLRVYDAAGRDVSNTINVIWNRADNNHATATLGFDNAAGGLYFYSVLIDGVPAGSGKLLVNKQ
jgi:hypothetical protein